MMPSHRGRMHETAETSFANGETGCCARLDEKAWGDKEFEWQYFQRGP